MNKHFAAFKKLPIFLFAALLTIDVSVLIMEKFAATTAGGGDGFSLRLLQIPWVWGIAVLSLMQLYVWNRILRRTPLSVAYPVSSLFFPLTMLCSVVVFHEHVSWLAWTGGVLVTLGIACFGGNDAPQSVLDDNLKAYVLERNYREAAIAEKEKDLTAVS
jgi:drug/metabolite transporter (DMT)-like permease